MSKRWGHGELARALKISAQALYGRIKSGRVQPPEYDSLRRVHFWTDEVVQQMLEQEEGEQKGEAPADLATLELYARAVKKALQEVLPEILRQYGITPPEGK
jgi:hypothetical protein